MLELFRSSIFVAALCMCLSGNSVVESSTADSITDSNYAYELRNAPGTCNKMFCVSVVSYCSLQQQCSCNPAVNCSCCRQCVMCLGDYYKHCCDCVKMCMKNVTMLLPTMTSTVDYLPEPQPELFRALTDRPLPQLKCQIVKFPVIEELAFHHQSTSMDSPIIVEHISGKGWTYSGMTAAEYWEQVQINLKEKLTFDVGLLCTVIYFDKCVSLEECTMSCHSMGAASYRWFHNGCCECVGFSCLNYGNSHPKCRDCMT